MSYREVVEALDKSTRKVHALEISNDRHKSENAKLKALLEEMAEFLQGQADADCRGDPPQYVPNRAMSLLTRIEEAIK